MFEERRGLDPRLEPGDEANALSRRVIGAAIEVHRHLGPGHIESAYRNALLQYEFELQGIPFQVEVQVPLMYKGRSVGKCRIDLLVGGELIVELKACDALGPVQRAQVISYLRLTGKRLGLLINFNVPVLKEGIRRIIQTDEI
jgi:GxxExxY protein